MNEIFVDRHWLSEALYFLKNSWKIVAAVVIGIVLSLMVISRMPVVYRAQATFYLNKSDLNSNFFTINEYHFYNLLLLDVEKMIQSNKFYNEVMDNMEEGAIGSALTYNEFRESLYVSISAESTFFVVGFDHPNGQLAEYMSSTIEKVMVKESSSIIQITAVEVVDQTVLLPYPVAPEKGMILVLGGMMGFFIGSVIVLISYLLNRKVNSYVDVQSLTNQNVLCHAKFKNLRKLSVDKIFDQRKRDDFQIVKQFLLYDKALYGQKVYSVVSNDESGKNETFALALAGHVGSTGEKTLFIPINPTDNFEMLLMKNYSNRSTRIKNMKTSIRYGTVVEGVADSLDILLGTNRKISFSQDKVDELSDFISELEGVYDIIIISIGLEEKLIFNLIQRGAFMMAVSNKSQKLKVKNNMKCLEGFEARILGAVYQE